jgi:hypothetical protein
MIVRQAVHHHRQQHRRIVRLHAPGDQPLLEVRGLVDAHDGVHAVDLVEPVMGAGEVVQIDGAPEARGLLGHAGGLNQAEGVNHHPAHVGLAVNLAGMGKV